MKDHDDIKKQVKSGYAKIASKGSSCCSGSSCCGSVDVAKISKKIGYTESDIESVPEGANLGLGCGNPVAIASLKEGDIVLDLGSGAGFDAFLAAKKVGNSGKVLGVDMTTEMIEKARSNAKKGNYSNVEFRLGEIEKLPVDDNSIDVIISNCVINLSTDKESVFREAYRVLKDGGKLMVSDLVLKKELPKNIRESVEAYVGCVAGAILKEAYIEQISKAGFKEIRIMDESPYAIESVSNNPTNSGKLLNDALNYVISLKIYARK
ncbi:MAG: arsenite methyltransferase [Pseudomonadota bacterium]